MNLGIPGYIKRENDQVQALAAEAIMDAQPWDYWEAGGRTPKGAAADGLRRLETVLERNPENVLAIHLYGAPSPTPPTSGSWRPERNTSCTCPRTPTTGSAASPTRSTPTSRRWRSTRPTSSRRATR